MARIRFIDAAIEDLQRLDGSVRKKVLAKIAGLEQDPARGLPLGSKPSGNLTTFRKLVVGDRSHRIVYRVEPDGDICVIWVIAGRADAECYDSALARLELLGDNPVSQAIEQALRMLRGRTATPED
jgi:mRNA interferase RelE/StbE